MGVGERPTTDGRGSKIPCSRWIRVGVTWWPVARISHGVHPTIRGGAAQQSMRNTFRSSGPPLCTAANRRFAFLCGLRCRLVRGCRGVREGGVVEKKRVRGFAAAVASASALVGAAWVGERRKDGGKRRGVNAAQRPQCRPAQTSQTASAVGGEWLSRSGGISVQWHFLRGAGEGRLAVLWH